MVAPLDVDPDCTRASSLSSYITLLLFGFLIVSTLTVGTKPATFLPQSARRSVTLAVAV